MMNLCYFELNGKIEEYNEKKKYLIGVDTVFNEKLDKTKKITGIEEFDNTKIQINTDDKLHNNS